MYYTLRGSYKIDSANNALNVSHSAIKDLLLQQWNRLTDKELEETGYIKKRIALLIQGKYGIHSLLLENYLSNLERTLPYNS